ncbi:MAG: metallophosphoesterase [Bacteroidota bacterium]
MNARLNFLYVLLTIYLLLDLYTFFGLRSLFPDKTDKLIFSSFYVAVSLFSLFSFYKVFQVVSTGSIFSDSSANIYLGLFFTMFVGKLIFTILMLTQDVGRLLWGLGDSIFATFSEGAKAGGVPSRRRFLTWTATGLAAVPFLGMLYGITKGKYAYTVSKVKLNFPDLPKAFEGFKIVQISDIHSGSFDNPGKVAEGVALVNAQQPDLLLFTGDLVNADKDEINPYLDIFSKLEAKEGKFSVLGNHDYYGAPDDRSESESYWKDFFSKYEQMGFRLMNNESTYIERDGEKICLLGVENWGMPPFPQIGDLDKALDNVQAEDFCILMSHDPTHWEHRVLPNEKKIHLTLSGHTHGMQFGINLPGMKWSPVQYRYKHWMGLYEEAKQYLYINRGFGFLAFPGRVGMWPEVTVIELGAV